MKKGKGISKEPLVVKESDYSTDEVIIDSRPYKTTTYYDKQFILDLLDRLEKEAAKRKVISPKMTSIYEETFIPLSVIQQVKKELKDEN